MLDQSNAPKLQPLAKADWDRHITETRRMDEARNRSRREAGRAALAEQARRYDPSVLVVIEYIGGDRDTLTEPITWNIGGRYYGFWKNEKHGLAPWQERVPASHGLPRVDGAPGKWKLIYDPRDADADGVLTEAEIEAAKPENEDGETTAAEFAGLEGYDDLLEDADDGIDANALAIELEQLEAKILKKAGDYRKDATDEEIMRHKALREQLGLE